jgi:hypothetical protein
MKCIAIDYSRLEYFDYVGIWRHIFPICVEIIFLFSDFIIDAHPYAHESQSQTEQTALQQELQPQNTTLIFIIKQVTG